jgi:hypothetical protein
MEYSNLKNKIKTGFNNIIEHPKYLLYLVPFYGTIDQYRKPKRERSKAGVIFSDAIIAGLIIKAGLFYAGKVATTGDWHPFRFNSKNKIERSIENKNSLEKTIDYEEIRR